MCIRDRESTRYAETHSEDVFVPGVRVQLSWKDIEEAVANGAIVPSEAHSLWAAWASSGSPQRLAARPPPVPMTQVDPDADPSAVRAPRFSFTNTLYYFGGMVAIGAMTLFMTLGWRCV